MVELHFSFEQASFLRPSTTCLSPTDVVHEKEKKKPVSNKGEPVVALLDGSSSSYVLPQQLHAVMSDKGQVAMDLRGGARAGTVTESVWGYGFRL